MNVSESLANVIAEVGVHPHEVVLVREIYESMIALREWSTPQGGNGIPFCAQSIINRHELVVLSYEHNGSSTIRKVTFSALGEQLFAALREHYQDK